AVVVTIVSAIVFLIFLILGIVFGSELMYTISMLVTFIYCASRYCILLGRIYLERTRMLESDFNNDLNQEKINDKQRFKKGAEFLFQSNKKLLPRDDYKPKFLDDKEYQSLAQEKILSEYVAK
ncbi:MAG: hypothetical protein IJU86_01480, partial [Firmicutes bacterium]|nr:hypothetical protein [Bacillota bacterium]